MSFAGFEILACAICSVKMPKKSYKSKLIDSIVVKYMSLMLNVEDTNEEEELWKEVLDELQAVMTHRYAVDFVPGSVEKSRAWVLNVLPNLDEDRFRQMVRVGWNQFQMILDEIKDDSVFRSKLQFPPELQLMLVLYRLGSSGEGASVAKIAALFGIGDGGTVDIITKRVFKAILAKKTRFLKWPDAEERAAIVAATIDELPYCVGYIDGTEIPLAERPCENPDDYYSRKQRFSIKAQIVCDYKCVIRSVCVGFAGSVHDSRMFNNSALGRRTPEFLSSPQWIAGDSAYKLTEHVITPFKASGRAATSERERLFNKIFSKYRVRVEHAFGELKERFSSIKELKIRIADKKSLEYCCNWFTVCVVLHNMIKFSSNDDHFVMSEDEGLDLEDDVPEDDPVGQGNDEGLVKRNSLMELLVQ